VAFSSIADAANAVQRLYGVFEAELLEERYVRDDSLDFAIEVKGAAFTWDSPPPEAAENKKKQKGHHRGASKEAALARAELTADKARAEEKAKSAEDNVFRMKDINLEIPRGGLVAIVGPVGTGKTSLLQGIIGEMRKTAGSVEFGGSVGYCPQSAWIQANFIFLIVGFAVHM
jgi:ABC-type glutathione transport system ATPase component